MSDAATDSRPVALVTGGARRVGRAISLALAKSGCDIIITYHTSKAEAAATRDACEACGVACRIKYLALDQLADVEAFARALGASERRLDIVVHNASMYAKFPDEPADAAHVEIAAQFYRVNALAPLILSRVLAPLLGASPLPGGGAIVAMADAHVLGRPRRGYIEYAMSKAALIEMVRTLARELAPNVRTNAVAPGVVLFPETGPEAHDAAQAAYLSRVPLKRAGTPEDAAEAVRWLALDATYVNGVVLPLDGGRLLA